MTRPITRREALATAAVAVTPLFAAAQDKKPADKSWVGLTVLPKNESTPAVRILPRPEGLPADSPETDRELPYDLSGISYTVKAEKGGRLQVVADYGEPVWMEKDAVVPLMEAVEFFSARIKDLPTNGPAYNARGWAQKLLGKHDEAIKDFDKYISLDPTSIDALCNRGLTHAEAGNFNKALVDLAAATAVGGGSHMMTQTNLGYVHELRGNYAVAVREYKRAADFNFSLAKNNLAWIRATCPDPKLRGWLDAVTLAKAVCDRCENLEGMYLDTLAAAMAETGKFDDAVKTQELAHKDKSYDLAYGDEGRARLKLYQQKKPFRTDPTKK